MNQFTPEKQREFIQDEIRAWVREDVDPQLRAAIAKRQKHIPTETIDKLRHQFYTDLGEGLGGYSLSFNDSGRIVDMKTVQWGKNPIQQDNNFILEWARKKGRAFFKKGVPGYTGNSRMGIDEDKQIQRIASAIIAAKGKNRGYKRRGQWYNKLMGRLVSRLTARLARNQADWIAGATREQIEKSFQQVRIEL